MSRPFPTRESRPLSVKNLSNNLSFAHGAGSWNEQDLRTADIALLHLPVVHKRTITYAPPCSPDNGFCESVLFWHIHRGHYGDVTLDGLSFVRVGRWDGDLWAGKVEGAAGLFIDERADSW